MQNYRSYLVILLTLLFLTMQTFADVKVRSRQITSGQTFENTTFIKGKRQRTEQNMGGLEMVNLTQCDLKRGVQINPKNQTYLIDSFLQENEDPTEKVSASSKDGVVRVGGTVNTTMTYKDTGEKRKMFGYEARHIITTIETVSSADACSVMNNKMQIDGWYIDAAFALDCETDRYRNSSYKIPQRSGCQDKYQTKTIGNGKRGLAVYEKMSMLDEKGKETFSTVTEVIELSKANLDATLFEIPADYREIKNASEIYAVSNTQGNSSNTGYSSGNSNSNSTSGVIENIKDQSNNANNSSDVGAKKEGVIRIGITIKTGSVGEGLNAGELVGAIQNSLGEYLKGTNIELVPLEAKLAATIENEAKEKECDYTLYVNTSHKKGGGGFGMFGKVIAPAIGQTGIGHTGSTAGNIAGQIATQAIMSAGSVSANVKAKDEISLDITLQKSGSFTFSKQYKAKAKSNGEDIISPIIEQVATAILANAK